ncbi:WD40 repeat-like protein, partial [Aureobasidium melanogenum]
MVLAIYLTAGLAAISAVNAMPFTIPYLDKTGRIEVQGHRGGLGMRSEESLWAFAHALEVGVDVLEMDTVFTKDGIPVIWHDSFDWRTLVGIHAAYPAVPIVALLDETTVVPDKTNKTYPWLKNSKYPWLGGLDLDDFSGDWVAAAHSIGSSILSPNHGTGNSSDATVNSPLYEPFTTKDVVDRAHALDMQVIPWTVDAEVTISKLLDDGVDAIISNYPERVMVLQNTLHGHTGTIRSLQTLDMTTGKFLSASRDGTIRLWSIKSTQCEKSIIAHEKGVRCLNHVDGTTASGGYDCQDCVWEILQGKCLQAFEGHSATLYSIAFDSTKLAAGAEDGEVRIWDRASGTLLASLNNGIGIPAQIRARNGTLISTVKNGALIFWNKSWFGQDHTVLAHDSIIIALYMTDPDLFTGGMDGVVKKWDLQSGDLTHECPPGTEFYTLLLLINTPPFMLSILLDDKVVLKLDILFILTVILAITYCVGLFLWIQRLNECLFFRAIARGFAAVERYFGFVYDKEDDPPQDDSFTSVHDNQVIGSEYSSNKNKDHDSVCWNDHQTAQRTSSINIDSNSSMSINTDAVPEEYILSRAECALLSIAAHLEEHVDDITQTEARDMLSKFRTLRSTVGSRVPLFIHQRRLPMNGFGPDAWFGEACLIDASIWLLKKNFPGYDASQSEFSGFDHNKENQDQQSPEQKFEEQEHGETVLQQEKQEQEQQEEESGSTSSHDQAGCHDDPVEPDMPSSPSNTSSSFDPVLTAKGLAFHVNYSVVDRLRGLSVPEVDELVVKLREHKRKLVEKRADAIVGSFWGGKKHVLEVKALCNARIGLADGIMAVIRQYNLSSESPVREPSDENIPSIFRLDNPRERRNSF